MAKKGLRKNKSSSQKEEETSAMSNACDVESTQEQPNLGSVLRRIVDQIDDAERSNADTLQEMQERLTSLSEQTSEAKNSNSEIDHGALEKIENQIAGLSDRIEIISEGRAINADNLEGRIEALAEQLSSEEAAAEARLQKRKSGGKTSSEENAGRSKSAVQGAAPSRPSTHEVDVGPAKDTLSGSARVSTNQVLNENAMDDHADITFVVTDDLEDESNIDRASVNQLDEEDLQSAVGDKLTAQSEGSAVREPHAHKITATAYDAAGPLEPNRLASLVEHFSPVIAPQIEEADSETVVENNLMEERDLPEKNQASSQPTPAAQSVAAAINLEERFSIIAEKLEASLASRDRDIQERVDISNKFDDLANKFEGWLQENNKSENFDSIEQKIGALTEHVQNAEEHAERIGVLEEQLVKLIDVVEKNAAGTDIAEGFEKSFEEAASRILEEKTAHLADLVASRMEARFEKNTGNEQLADLKHTLSALSSEHRLADTTQSSRLSSVDSTLNAISGRLNLIEEQLQFENMNASREVKKNLIEQEMELQAPEIQVEAPEIMPDLPEQSLPAQNIDQVETTVGSETEDNSFHTELELSVHQVIDDRADIEFIPDEPLHQSEGPQGQEPDAPMMLSQQNEQVRSEPPFPPNAQGANEEYVETARQAAKRAFAKNQLSQSEPEKSGVVQNSVQSLLNIFHEHKWKFADLGEKTKNYILSLRHFRSTSVLVVGAAGLVIVCFGILYKELSGVSKMRRTQLEASNPVDRSQQDPKQSFSTMNRRLAKSVEPERRGRQEKTENQAGVFRSADRSASLAQNKRVTAKHAIGPEDKPGFNDIQRNRRIEQKQHLVSPAERRRKEKGEKRSQGQNAFPDRIPISSERGDHAANGMSVSFGNDDAGQFRQTGQGAFPGARNIDMNDLMALNQKGKAIKGTYVQVGQGVPRNNLKYIKKRDIGDDVDASLILPEQLGSESLRTAAASGNYKAQFAVAMRFKEGKRIDRNYPAARRWLKRSASQSFAPAQYQLAVMYEKGQGGARDQGMARTWYKRAARGGNIRAMHNLAVLMTLRSGANPDYPQAVQWFRRAASYGHPDSQYNLGILYDSGMGVQRNKVEAYKWYSLAAAVGDQQAMQKLNKLKFNMSQEDIVTAESRLVAWTRKRPAKSANLNAREASAFSGRILTPYADIQIYEAQVLLNKLGYNVGLADGQIGPKTREAVRKFQLKNALEPSGSVTQELIDILRAQVS